jgi:hypothetical protein
MSETSFRDLSLYFDEQMLSHLPHQYEPALGQPISKNRVSLSCPAGSAPTTRRSMPCRVDYSKCKVPGLDVNSLNPDDAAENGNLQNSRKRGSLSSGPGSALNGRSMPIRSSDECKNPGIRNDSLITKGERKNHDKRGNSSLNISCPPDLQSSDITTSTEFSWSSTEVGENEDLAPFQEECNKRQKGYCKEGSLVSTFLRKLLLPNLSSLKFISDSKLTDSASKLSFIDQEENEQASSSYDFPVAGEILEAQSSHHELHELEKNLLQEIEKLISCSSIASFAICNEGCEDSSDNNGAPQEDEVSPIDLSDPLTDKDLRSLFKTLSSPISCLSTSDDCTNDSFSSDMNLDFGMIVSSPDLTENCKNIFTRMRKISSLENASRTRPLLSRSIAGIGRRSTPNAAVSAQKPLSAPGSSVSSPTDIDIMFGKGAKYNKHSGNIKYREVVESMKPLYRDQGTSKKGKKAVTLRCLEKIHDYGGRFLELVSVNPEIWVVVPANKAREKISQRIRENK